MSLSTPNAPPIHRTGRRDTIGAMRETIDTILDRGGQLATRADLLAAVSVAAADDEIRRGHLVRVFARTYARPWRAEFDDIRDAAALRSVGQPAVLSHLTALSRWGLAPPAEQVHVTVPIARAPRHQPGLRVHRTRRVPRQLRLAGLPTVSAAEAVTSCWSLLPTDRRRAAVIDAVRTRMTGVDRIRAAILAQPRLAGRGELSGLLDLLASGCQSELEIWGRLVVFDVPGLNHGVRQHRLTIRGRTYLLDLAYPAERVAVEMDGERFHGTPAARERDRRRDTALASIGWVTLRYGFARLHRDVAGCRRDTLAALAARRAQPVRATVHS